jgi:hypothetical protein
MTTFNFTFDFLGSSYTANCHVIYPPPDKQYHVIVDDEHLRFQYGDVQMFVLKGDEFNWGIPPQPKGSEFMRSLMSALKGILEYHPEY